MTNPLISVIVPVYNAGKYFDKCIESLRGQTYENLEIILVDDGSTDGTPAKCDEYAAEDSRIKVIHKVNGGASSARNTGLDVATGDYIGFCDADDYIDQDTYEIMMNEILEYGADAARCGIVREADDGRTENWGTGNYDVRVMDKKQVLADVGEAVGILPVSPSNKLFKRECIVDIRFDTRFHFAEDTLFNFMAAKNIEKMVYHDVNRYHYTFNAGSITNKGINENNFDEHRVMDEIFKLCDEDTLPHAVKGDVLKSFRTLKQIIKSGRYEDRFDSIRERIVSHKDEIFSLPIYSRLTHMRARMLIVSPAAYRFVIKNFR